MALDATALNVTALANRYAGRLFSEQGRLHLVIDVDTESGFARVSCRANGEQQIIQMPISEVGLRLSSRSNLLLDSLSNTETSNRIIHQTDGWFFTTRGGLKGPYPSDTDARQALSNHILSAQGESAPKH